MRRKSCTDQNSLNCGFSYVWGLERIDDGWIVFSLRDEERSTRVKARLTQSLNNVLQPIRPKNSRGGVASGWNLGWRSLRVFQLN